VKRKKSSSAGRKKSASKRVKYTMRLYVTGATPKSSQAITNLRKLCDEYIPGQVELKIIDVYQQPKLAREGQIIAAPTLIKSFPPPLRRFIGDMSNTENLLLGLEIRRDLAADSSGGSMED
jgi:circadian clock protein KaiB